jgi:hypothetical protein
LKGILSKTPSVKLLLGIFFPLCNIELLVQWSSLKNVLEIWIKTDHWLANAFEDKVVS